VIRSAFLAVCALLLALTALRNGLGTDLGLSQVCFAVYIALDLARERFRVTA
jgi:hypothetical protein